MLVRITLKEADKGLARSGLGRVQLKSKVRLIDMQRQRRWQHLYLGDQIGMTRSFFCQKLLNMCRLDLGRLAKGLIEKLHERVVCSHKISLCIR